MEDLGVFKLPAADESILDKAARAIANSGNNPDATTAGQRLASLADQATKYQVGGYSLSNMGTKAKEAGLALAASFGINTTAASKKIGALGGANAAATTPSTAIGTSTVSASQVKSASDDKEYIVSLRDIDGYIMEFSVMPTIVENRSAQYEPVAPPQFPGAFQKYKGTDSTTWSLNCMFISRTSEEASINLRNVFRLRSWVMPYFGLATAKDQRFKNRIGAPPPVLKLKGLRGLVGEVPVVVTTLNWNWRTDVDYIPAWDPADIGDTLNPQEINKPGYAPKIPFPVVLEVAINLTESYSTTEINNFDLGLYRLGKAPKSFATTKHSAEEQSTTLSPHNKQEAQTVNKLMRPPIFLTDTSGPSLSGITPATDPAFANSMLNGETFMGQATVTELNKNLLPVLPRRGGTRAEVNAAGIYTAKGDK